MHIALMSSSNGYSKLLYAKFAFTNSFKLITDVGIAFEKLLPPIHKAFNFNNEPISAGSSSVGAVYGK